MSTSVEGEVKRIKEILDDPSVGDLSEEEKKQVLDVMDRLKKMLDWNEDQKKRLYKFAVSLNDPKDLFLAGMIEGTVTTLEKTLEQCLPPKQ